MEQEIGIVVMEGGDNSEDPESAGNSHLEDSRERMQGTVYVELNQVRNEGEEVE